MTATTSVIRHQVQQELDLIPTQHFPSLLQIIRDFRESLTVPSAEECFRHLSKKR